MNSSLSVAGLPFAILPSVIFAGSTTANGVMLNSRAVSAIGFESRLWQREFAPDNKFDTSRAAYAAPDAKLPQHQRKPVGTASNSRPIAGATETEVQGGGDTPSVVGADLADPVPVAVTVQQIDAYLKQEAATTTVNHRMISEWDKVIANTAGKDGVGEGFTTTGPTLTTYLVAIVATIVAVGCTITPK